VLITVTIASILAIAPSLVSPTKAIALTYHDITPRKQVWFDCTLTEFESQIRWLKSQKAHFATPKEIERLILGVGTVPPRTVLITFADNYRGFYKYALPILTRYQIPSIQFVHSGYVGSPQGRPKMTWTELAECVQKGVTIGSQTVTHRPVTELKPAEFLKEMADSQRELRARLSQPIYYFAYPDGKHNFAVESIASKYYDLAFAETQVPITPKSNRYAVPRYVHTQWRKAWADLMR